MRVRNLYIGGCAAITVLIGGATTHSLASEQQPMEPEFIVPTQAPNGTHEVHADEPGDAPTLVVYPLEIGRNLRQR